MGIGGSFIGVSKFKHNTSIYGEENVMIHLYLYYNNNDAKHLFLVQPHFCGRQNLDFGSNVP